MIVAIRRAEVSDCRDLEHFWVGPAWMRRRVGSTLFAHAIESARTAGAAALVIASDPHAAGFYEQMGAHRIGDVSSTPEGRTLPVLRIDLAPLSFHPPAR